MRYAIFSFLLPVLALLCLMALPGCNEEQIARAEAGVVKAQDLLDQAQAKQADAVAALAAAKALAGRMDATAAAAIIGRCEAAARDSAALLPIAQEGVDRSKAAVAAAKESQASGASTWEVVGSVALAFLTGGGGVRVLAQRGAAVTATALQIVGDFSKQAAKVDTDEEVMTARIAAMQRAAAASDPRVVELVSSHVMPA